jgi:hypothetical protein
MINYRTAAGLVALTLLVAACDSDEIPVDMEGADALPAEANMEPAAQAEADVDALARTTDTGAEICTVLPRTEWVAYGSCEAACDQRCGDAHGVYGTWLICLCYYN